MELVNLYPYKLRPVLKDIIWGGSRLSKEYGKGEDTQKIAESWEVSVREKENSVIENGELKGQTLKEIIIKSGGKIVSDKFPAERMYVGNAFPLLIKLIDAASKLSVQVHPDDSFAKNNGETNGKTEMWYIVDAEENAKIVYGFAHDVTEGEIRKSIEEGTFEEHLNYIPVKKGGCYFIPAGLVHAIGEGILIAEIQQNSDTTYRFYDYNRTDDKGNKRELHIDKAIASSMKTKTDYMSSSCEIARNDIYTLYSLAECPYFTVFKFILHCGKTMYTTCVDSFDSSFQSLLFTDGEGYIEYNGEKYPYRKGDSYFIPFGMEKYTIHADSETEIIISKI